MRPMSLRIHRSGIIRQWLAEHLGLLVIKEAKDNPVE
jgi:hypothetical protein